MNAAVPKCLGSYGQLPGKPACLGGTIGSACRETACPKGGEVQSFLVARCEKLPSRLSIDRTAVCEHTVQGLSSTNFASGSPRLLLLSPTGTCSTCPTLDFVGHCLARALCQRLLNLAERSNGARCISTTNFDSLLFPPATSLLPPRGAVFSPLPRFLVLSKKRSPHRCPASCSSEHPFLCSVATLT